MIIKTFPITKILKFTIVLIVILAAGALSVYAQKTTRQISGVSFDENIVADGKLFKLENVGLLRYKMLFKGYVAALYMGDECLVKDVFDDIPKRIELVYFWSITAEDLVMSSEKVLLRNVPEKQLPKLRSRVEKLHQAYQDVKPKDRYALTYIPGKGSEMTLNAKSVITIKGADFARAYFSIWLGKQPLDKGLRDTLLGATKD